MNSVRRDQYVHFFEWWKTICGLSNLERLICPLKFSSRTKIGIYSKIKNKKSVRDRTQSLILNFLVLWHIAQPRSWILKFNMSFCFGKVKLTPICRYLHTWSTIYRPLSVHKRRWSNEILIKDTTMLYGANSFLSKLKYIFSFYKYKSFWFCLL